MNLSKLILPPTHQDLEKSYKAGFLHFSLIITSFALLVFGFLNLEWGAFALGRILLIFSGICLIGIILNKINYYYPAATLLSIIIFVAIFYNIIDGAALHDPGIAALPIFILLTGFLYRKKHIPIFTLISVLGVITIYALWNLDQIPLNQNPTINRVVILSILQVTIGFITWIIISTFQNTITNLNASEKQLRVFFNDSPAINYDFILDPPLPLDLSVEKQIDWIMGKTSLLNVSTAYVESVQTPINELIGLSILDTWGGDRRFGNVTVREFIEHGYKLKVYETRELTIHGDLAWSIINAVGVVEDQQLTRIWGTNLDITDRKVTELELQDSEEKFHTVFMKSPYAMTITRLEDGVYVDLNEGFGKNLGYSRAEVIGHTAMDIGLIKDPHALEEIDRILRREGEVGDFELIFIHKDGRELISQVSSAIIELNGETHRVSVGKDITKLRESEQEIRESEARYRTLFENASDVIFILDGDQIIDCNNAVLRMFGYTKEETIGRHPGQISPRRQPDGYESISKAEILIRKVQEGYPQLFEWVHQRKDGSDFTTEVNLHQIMVQDKPLILSFVRDVTERKMGEQAVFEERQRLARDLHDAVSQTLWSASLIADVLPDVWQQNPTKGLERLGRLRQLTHGAMAEMRALLLELRPTALIETKMAELLKQLVKATTSHSGVQISLNVEGECDLPEIVHIALYRITQEALNNTTRHAMASEIKIRLKCGPKYANLEIEDNGRGFNPENIPTGQHLGLQIMRERASSINASLNIISQSGGGTKVDLIWTGDREVNDG